MRRSRIPTSAWTRTRRRRGTAYMYSIQALHVQTSVFLVSRPSVYAPCGNTSPGFCPVKRFLSASVHSQKGVPQQRITRACQRALSGACTWRTTGGAAKTVTRPRARTGKPLLASSGDKIDYQDWWVIKPIREKKNKGTQCIIDPMDLTYRKLQTPQNAPGQQRRTTCAKPGKRAASRRLQPSVLD
jgi:hypothetical protein